VITYHLGITNELFEYYSNLSVTPLVNQSHEADYMFIEQDNLVVLRATLIFHFTHKNIKFIHLIPGDIRTVYTIEEDLTINSSIVLSS
jgi:hypothetical protein